jgi:Ca2+-binding EF-hand superfamily protein
MASALPNASEIKYLQDDAEDTPGAGADGAQPRARDDALRRQRRNSAKDFFSTPASVRLSVSGTSNRVAPEPRPAKGRMTQTEVNRYIKKFSHMQPEEIRSLEALFHSWDLDNSGEISMEEMMVMMERVVRDLFDKTDADNSGMLDAEEVRQLALDLGQNLTNEELQEAMAQMDREGVGAVGPNGVQGMVGFDEFAAWWLGKGGKDSTADAQAEELADLFSEVDSDGSGAIDVDEFIGMIAGKMESITLRSTNTSGGERPVREGITMVRLALQSVKDDVRAIYGMDERPKSTLRAAQELENTTRQRRCFFTTEPLGKPLVVNFRKGWDIVQVFVLAYIALIVPYRTGFDIEVPTDSATFWFEVACDIYFVFDIALNFRTAYRDGDGILITDSKEIARVYMRSWLLIDICACFPVTYIELLVGADGGVGAKLKALKIFRLLRLAKMLRLAKLKKVLKHIDETYAGVWTLSKLSSLIAIILYMAHIFACGWYAVGSVSQTLVNGVTIHGWVRRLGYDSSFDYTDDGTAHEAYNHISNWPVDDQVTPYLDAYYYAITTLTTVGYGDRCPVTDVEKVFSIVTEVAGGITFGILAGTLSAMVTESNAGEKQAADHLDSLKTFMSAKRVHHTLRHQIMEQMEYFFRTKTVFDESDIMEKLPPKFRKSLLLTMYKPQLRTCPLFAGLEETIITKLALSLRPYLGLEGDCVIQEGELGEDMCARATMISVLHLRRATVLSQLYLANDALNGCHVVMSGIWLCGAK